MEVNIGDYIRYDQNAHELGRYPKFVISQVDEIVILQANSLYQVFRTTLGDWVDERDVGEDCVLTEIEIKNSPH